MRAEPNPITIGGLNLNNNRGIIGEHTLGEIFVSRNSINAKLVPCKKKESFLIDAWVSGVASCSVERARFVFHERKNAITFGERYPGQWVYQRRHQLAPSKWLPQNCSTCCRKLKSARGSSTREFGSTTSQPKISNKGAATSQQHFCSTEVLQLHPDSCAAAQETGMFWWPVK